MGPKPPIPLAHHDTIQYWAHKPDTGMKQTRRPSITCQCEDQITNGFRF